MHCAPAACIVTARLLSFAPSHRHRLSLSQNLYAVLTMVALAGILPIALLAEGRSIVAGTLATIESIGLTRFVRMLLLCGLSHYTYNECAFVALSSVHPVTHAVANTIKRVAVIVISVLYFRNPLTLTGAVGSTIAIIGVLLYSLAKAQPPPPPRPPKLIAALPTTARDEPSAVLTAARPRYRRRSSQQYRR